MSELNRAIVFDELGSVQFIRVDRNSWGFRGFAVGLINCGVLPLYIMLGPLPEGSWNRVNGTQEQL